LSCVAPVKFTGSRYYRGHWDFVYYLQDIVRQRLGVELLDAFGNSFVDVLRSDNERVDLLKERVFGTLKLTSLYASYKSAQENTNIPVTDKKFRPHGHRVFTNEQTRNAMDKGILSPTLADGLANQLSHSTTSRHNRGVYLSEAYVQTFSFAAVYSPNPHVRKLGVVGDLPTLTEELGYVPRVLYRPDKKNLEVVRSMVECKIAVDKFNVDAALNHRQSCSVTNFGKLKKPASRLVSTKLRILKQRFGKAHLPETIFMPVSKRLSYVDSVWVSTLSLGMSRGDIVSWFRETVLPLW
jgi:hypothetical protein